MQPTNLPIITQVTGYRQFNGLTTIYFTFNFLDGQGVQSLDFQINDYEMHWYYQKLGWDKRYSPFQDFWDGSGEKERLDFLYLMVAADNSVVSMSVKAKLRKGNQTRIIKSEGAVRSLFRALAS